VINLIKQITEKSPPIFRWLKQNFRNSDHLVPAFQNFNKCETLNDIRIFEKLNNLREIKTDCQVIENDATLERPRHPFRVSTPERLEINY
jgi:hypothetical protein